MTIHYHGPKALAKYFQGYDPLKPVFKGPGFHYLEPFSQPEFYNEIASSQMKYDKNGNPLPNKSVDAFILLGRATSTPLAMSEFAVPHELGHCYQYPYVPSYGTNDKAWKEYMKLHGLKPNSPTARHHESNAEAFANTFHILFSPYQHDFWPHKAKHPFKVKGLKTYLSKILK